MAGKGHSEETMRWARGQVAEYAKRRGNYEVFAGTLREVLRQGTRDVAPLAIIQTRPKDVSSFAEKAFRKRAKRPYPVDQFTDLCGARVIVDTDEQVDAVCAFIKDHFDIDWDNSDDAGERLGASAFGYRSVHLIVSFRRPSDREGKKGFPNRAVPVDVPRVLYTMPNPRAEIQVRTILQHAWATTGHDPLYKAGFDVPAYFHREFARVAAMLETADDMIGRSLTGLRMYASNRGAYMTDEQLRDELELLRFVASHAPGDRTLAMRMAGVAEALGDWNAVIEALTGHWRSERPEVLLAMGAALCRRGRKGDLDRGRGMLERAAAAGEPRALAESAASWQRTDPERARALYREALAAMPDEPRMLECHLDAEIAARRDIEIASTAAPAIARAIEVCLARAAVGVDLPAAYLTAGKLYLLRGDPYGALDAYAKAVQLANLPVEIRDGLESLERLGVVSAALQGYEWCHRMLLLGLATRYAHAREELDEARRDADSGRMRRPTAAELRAVEQADAATAEGRARLAKLATAGAAAIEGPVAWVAGGCDPSQTEAMHAYREMLVGGFRDFCGTVVGGGTKQGVSGLVGDVAGATEGVRAISWLPTHIDVRGDATLDPRYDDIRYVAGVDFSAMEPLQGWTDLVASGIDPRDVKLVGINGGRIAAAEYRIALALGAYVALVQESGREAAKLIPDERWGLSERLLTLPAEAESLRPLLRARCDAFAEDVREALAQRIHVEYLRTKRAQRTSDPSLSEWPGLPDSLKDSNRAQADDVLGKLRELGLTVRPAEGAFRPIKLRKAEVEHLAREEHGRWVAERLLAGWRYAEVKDVASKRSPYLVTWDELSDEVREWDRATVRAIPAMLADVGFRVVRG